MVVYHHMKLSSSGLTGRSSIPETAGMESKGTAYWITRLAGDDSFDLDDRFAWTTALM
jgi:hypothetical protein